MNTRRTRKLALSAARKLAVSKFQSQLTTTLYMVHVQHMHFGQHYSPLVLIDFSLTVKAATLIFISGHGSAISSAKKGRSGFIYNLVKS